MYAVDTVNSCAAARKAVKESIYDIVIINSPLKDEFGEKLAIEVSKMSYTQVLTIVKSDCFDLISEKTETNGVLVVSKPVNKPMFWSALKLAKSSLLKVKKIQEENDKLKKKLESTKLIDRAKWLLVSYVGMNENDAHKYIEKQAMDLRITKREVAEGILKT